MKNLTITLLLSIFLMVGVTAQEMETIEYKEPGKLSIGIHLGASQSGTDTHSWGRHGESLFNRAGLAYGLNLSYKLSNSLNIRANWMGTKISGDDNDVFGPCNVWVDGVESEDLDDCLEHEQRGWKFTSPLNEVGLDLEWEFLGSRRNTNNSVYDANGNMVNPRDVTDGVYYNKDGEVADIANLGKFKKVISPYITGGVALTFVKPEPIYNDGSGYQPSAADIQADADAQKSSYLHFPVGAGLRIDLSEKMFLDLEARGVFPQTDMLDGMSETVDFDNELNNEDSYHFALARLNFRMGSVGDCDDDGLNDNFDRCQCEPGTLKTWGCPDTDGDGIIDKNDACPNVPGVRRMDGCPDSDGDNVADSKDKCPEVAGLVRFDGCPDSDGDGIPDNVDDCPTVAGEKEYNGCLAPDTDGDGVIDRDDKCVNTPGTINGCPDTDGDGIIDMEDKCPKTPGIAKENGCPAKVVRPTTTVVRPVLLTCETIYFNTNQSSVGNNTKDRYLDAKENVAIFERAMSKLNENDSYRAVVQGHTDSRNTDEYNQKLSERRANEVLEGMISRGFPGTRTSAVGFGESSPVASNDTKQGRAQNRRVEICIYDR